MNEFPNFLYIRFKSNAKECLSTAGRLRQAHAQFRTLDARPYLDEMQTERVLERDTLPKEHFPWQRFFARLLDGQIYRTLWMLLLPALGFNMLKNSRGGMLFLELLTLGTMFLLEPLLLSRFGTTPGKWLFGLRVTSPDGRKLTYAEGRERTAYLFWYGIRLNLPFFRLYRLYVSYTDEQQGKALPWEDYIPVNGKFWVKKASSIKSKLFSPSDIQSIAKKAMVERMKQYYDVEWFAEDGAPYPVRIFLLKDEVMVTLDTSGDSLHKRGYRTLTSKAPLTETLAASLLLLTPWRPDRILVDPFCGSGTFPIEAAMIAAGIAPGMNREFTAEQWTNLIDRKLWYECVKEAEEMIHTDVKVDIQGYDIDGDVIKAARENAKRAGVDHLIHFQQRPVAELHHPKKYGFIVTNPPYGERLEDKADLPKLYGEIGAAFRGLDSWSMYLITSYDEAERYIGRKADKNRKIYNGMLRTYFYQFMGPKPPRRSVRDTAGGDE